MEFLNNPISGELAKIGLCLLAHSTIILNREVIRPRLNSEVYNRVSLQLEHVASRGTFAAFLDGTIGLGVILQHVPYKYSPFFYAGMAWVWGMIKDGVTPQRPQIDQIISNTVGCVAYLALASSNLP